MKRIPYNVSGTAYSIILLIGNSWSQMEEAEASFDLISNQSCKHLHCKLCWCYEQAWLFTIFDIISSCYCLFLENRSLLWITHNLHKTLWREYFLGWVTKLQTIGHNDTLNYNNGTYKISHHGSNFLSKHFLQVVAVGAWEQITFHWVDFECSRARQTYWKII